MEQIALDRGWDTGAVHRGLEILCLIGCMSAIQFSNSPEKYGFSYVPESDAFLCPRGKHLLFIRLNCNKLTGKYLRCYQAAREDCQSCPNRQICPGQQTFAAEYWQAAAIRRSFGDIAVLEMKNILQ